MIPIHLHSIPFLGYPLGILLLTFGTLGTGADQSKAEEPTAWTIPLAGNTFQTIPDAATRSGRGEGVLRRSVRWSDEEDVFSIFFHVDRPATLDLGIRGSASEGESKIRIEVLGNVFTMNCHGSEETTFSVGQVSCKRAGYIQIDLKGQQRSGKVFAELQSLIVSSQTPGLELDFVRNNEGNMFYWGRRGPSVHLKYETPSDRSLQYAYSEIMVPVGQDPIGSYFMANGFGQGYFGIQVNRPTERRVLFSVWSPFKTDDPGEIPADQRIVLLGKGAKTTVGQFGNEGSGGQSYVVFPWRAGKTYQFLTEVRPAGDDKTDYTCWFAEKGTNVWNLVASFRRPKTKTYLTGFHSFLENFSPTFGNQQRSAEYGNVWVRDAKQKWHPCTKARFSVDATGRGRHRLDYAGGIQGNAFTLRNGGFFDETTTPGKALTRGAEPLQPPSIDFDTLPRS